MQNSDEINGYRVLLIDDHPTIRQGLRFFLQASGKILVSEICEVGTYHEALEIIDQDQFDIAILDLSLHENSGLDLIPQLEDCAIAVLVYSMHEDVGTINKAFQAGALGYVTKREDTNLLIDAMNTIGHGKRYTSSYVSAAIERERGKEDPIEKALSLREQEVFALIGKGIGNAEIANHLDISIGTVGTYVSRIVLKLEVGNRRALRKYAVESTLPITESR